MTCWNVGRLVQRIVSLSRPGLNEIRSFVASARQAAGVGALLGRELLRRLLKRLPQLRAAARQRAAAAVAEVEAPGLLAVEQPAQVLVDVAVPAAAEGGSVAPGRVLVRLDVRRKVVGQGAAEPGGEQGIAISVNAVSMIAAPGSSILPSRFPSIREPPWCRQASSRLAAWPLSASGAFVFGPAPRGSWATRARA